MRRYLVGDVFDRMADIGDGTVSLVACSPPFIALRSYLPADHPDKSKEIGSEPNPAAFIDTLLALTAEWGRVLAPWGSIAIELGDTYSGSGGAGGDYNEGGMRSGQSSFSGSAAHERSAHDGHSPSQPSPNSEYDSPQVLHVATDGKDKPLPRTGHDRLEGGFTGRRGHGSGSGSGWPAAKSLALIPQAYALSLVYGRNVLTGAESPAGRWLVRNEIVWHRPNPAVGALGDKVRPSTSYICVATRSPKRWFDLTAVRTTGPRTTERPFVTGRHASSAGVMNKAFSDKPEGSTITQNAAGAPPLDCWFDQHDTWTITTQPSRLAHYAMWPPKLAERLILMMCPLEVCNVCGEPRRRIDGPAEYVNARTGRPVDAAKWIGVGRQTQGAIGRDNGSLRSVTTDSWTDCGCSHDPSARAGRDQDFTGPSHDAYRPGVVLDPFAGTGTTLNVAELHGRDSIGIDIDARNEALMEPRMDECRRALFGTLPELPGQLGFDGMAS